MVGVALEESVEDGGVGSVMTDTMAELFLLWLLSSFEDIEAEGERFEFERQSVLCGRANCSMLNGLFRGGTWFGFGVKGAWMEGCDKGEGEKLLMLVNGELGVNNEDIRDPMGELSEFNVDDEFGCW